MDISVRTKTHLTDDRSWLGSAHGSDATETITLDISTFTAGTHYPNGFLPSGLAVGKITGSGKYGPYSNAAADGRETMVGHLFSAVRPRTDADVDAAGAMLTHGVIVEAKLPSGHGVDANGKTDVAGRIRYR